MVAQVDSAAKEAMAVAEEMAATVETVVAVEMAAMAVTS